jgi:hypothetical protein
MIPVNQTTFGTTKESPEVGNCWSACIASLLEIPVEEVPTFAALDDWFEETRDWLFSRGWEILPIHPSALMALSGGRFEGWLIATGKSPRGVHNHSILVSMDAFHDPHPSKDGLDGPIKEFALVYRESSVQLAMLPTAVTL